VHPKDQKILKIINSHYTWYRKISHRQFFYLALNQCTTRLNQVIHYNNMTSSRISLFYPYNSLLPFSNFVTYNLQKSNLWKQSIKEGASLFVSWFGIGGSTQTKTYHRKMLKLLIEALPCTIIWKCYGYLIKILKIVSDETMYNINKINLLFTWVYSHYGNQVAPEAYFLARGCHSRNTVRLSLQSRISPDVLLSTRLFTHWC
jgi:hypothetical protein